MKNCWRILAEILKKNKMASKNSGTREQAVRGWYFQDTSDSPTPSGWSLELSNQPLYMYVLENRRLFENLEWRLVHLLILSGWIYNTKINSCYKHFSCFLFYFLC